MSPSEPRPPVQIRQVAKSFYGMLTNEGFTQDQIVHLANDLLTLVQSDLRTPGPAPAR